MNTSRSAYSYFLLLGLTSLSAYFLVQPYFSPAFSGNNSMGGLGYMMLAPFLGIIATAIVIIVFLALSILFKLDKLPSHTAFIFPLILNLAAANFIIVEATIFAPFTIISTVGEDAYKHNHIQVTLSSISVVKQDHAVFPAKVPYTLDINNTGEKEKDYSLTVQIGHFTQGDQDRQAAGEIMFTTGMVKLAPGINHIHNEALVDSYVLRCFFDRDHPGEPLILRYWFEGPGNAEIRYIPLNAFLVYQPLKDLQPEIVDDGRGPCK